MNPYTRPILLVEDNPMDVDLTRRAFIRRRVLNPLEIARDGEEALAYLERWERGEKVPFVVLMDLKLPKVGGLEVLRLYKSHPLFKCIPVVVLTTSNDERDIQQAYQLGANSYVIKPVNFEKFMQVADQIDQYWTGLNVPVR